MKKVLILSALLVVSNVLSAVVHSSKKQMKKAISLEELVESSNKELEKKWIIDLSWKEKLSLWILKKKLKKAIKKNPALANHKIQLDQLRVQEVNKKNEGLGVASFTLGVISILSLLSPILLPLVLILAPLGLIFGIISIAKISKHPEKNKNLWAAITGTIICGILVILALLLLAVAVPAA